MPNTTCLSSVFSGSTISGESVRFSSELRVEKINSCSPQAKLEVLRSLRVYTRKGFWRKQVKV
ncbi:hypothetical protein HanPI659440_Chr02g0082741 [Helianthus annuus]|nr:hypothetical protein HanPI659440_Chr02g0082741 [Helianthus annuus]